MSAEDDTAGADAGTGAGEGAYVALAVDEPELTTIDSVDPLPDPPPTVPADPPSEGIVGLRWILRTTMIGLGPEGAATAVA